MFSKLLDKISSNKKNILWIIGWFLLFFILSDSVFADAASDKVTLDKAKQTASSAITWIWTTLAVFLSLLTYLSTVFLSPEWINGSLFWLNSYFKSIWILVSNVVYLIFAFILIWIAFMNIIWKWQEKYALKQALPKFIVGILIVPFSWFLIQFILSISAVLTISALNLPFETFSTFKTSLSTVEIPKDCTLNLKSTWKSENTTNTSAKEPDKWFFNCEWDKVKLDVVLNSWKSSDSIFGILATYTYWVLWLENLSKLNYTDLSAIKTMWDLVVKLLFDVLFVIVYSVLMVALWLVLMVRWIYIWIYIMISPVFWLMYFFDKTSGWWEFFDKFNVKQFISLAMVPVYTMLALTFWLLFMFIVWNWITWGNSSTKDVDNVVIKEEWDKWSKIIIWWDTKWEWGFSLSVIWSPANPQNITWFVKEVWNNTLWVIGTLIMKIFGIVVLWWAVMAALRSNEMTKAIVEPLHAFGTQVWWLVTKAPQYAPIFGGQSMTSLGQIGSSASSYFETKARERWTDFMKKHELFWQNWSIDLSNKSINALQRLQKSNLNDSSVWDDYKKAYDEWKDIQSLANNKNYVELLQEMLKKWWNEEAAKNIKFWDRDSIAKWHIILDWIADTKYNSQSGGWLIKWTDSTWSKNTANDLDKLKRENQKNQDIWTTANQTINLNIKNWSNSLPVTLNNVNLTDKQKADISSIDISPINTKANMIKELNKIWITEASIIENIIKAIDPTWVKFSA